MGKCGCAMRLIVVGVRGCLKPIKACGIAESAFFLVAPPRGGLSVAPRDSDRCWKQFMMCLEGIRFVAMIHCDFSISSPCTTRSWRRYTVQLGSVCARVPVYRRYSSVVVVGVSISFSNDKIHFAGKDYHSKFFHILLL